MLKEGQRKGPWDRNLWHVLSLCKAGLAGGPAVLRLEHSRVASGQSGRVLVSRNIQRGPSTEREDP